MPFWNNKPLIITIILVIILFVLLVATGGEQQPGASSLVSGIFAPIQEGLYSATESMGNFFGRLFSTSDLDKENQQLKEEIAKLNSDLREYDELKKENERLTELLNVKDSVGDYDYLTARVTGKALGDWFTEFTVNAGKNDGVQKNMVVLNQEGLLGRVTSASDHYCKIMTIIDLSSGVPVIVERTRDTGVAKGLYSTEGQANRTLSLSYLPSGADIVPGDRILTSGQGGVFPKGLLVGQVSEVAGKESSEVSIKSAVDFAHIEEVVILLQVFGEAG